MIKKIDVSQIDIGMYVTELDRPWLETPFIFSIKTIKNSQMVDRIKAAGIKYLYIDTQRGKDVKEAVPKQEVEKNLVTEMERQISGISTTPQNIDIPVPSSEEYRVDLLKTQKVRSDLQLTVSAMNDSLAKGEPVDAPRLHDAAERLAEAAIKNHDAVMALARQKNRHEYTNNHTANVALLSVAIGRSIGLKQEELVVLSLGGMLHDIGYTRVPGEIIRKPGKLTAEEFELIRMHVAFGAEMINSKNEFPQDAIDMLLHHHERLDGSGYPKKLKGADVSIAGQVGAIADVYDAITSQRAYHDDMQNFDGLKKMYEWSAEQFNKQIVEKFIQAIGLIPVGSLVRFADHKMGIVWKVNRGSLLRPTVIMCYHAAQKRFIRPFERDMNDPVNSDMRIVAVENPQKWGINVEEYV